jgi:hypothetical protein
VSNPVLPKIQVPSKWDIIPIHASDVAAFKRCRRYWDWSSPTRTNLRRRVDLDGISFPLWFGTGAHYSLESMYDPIMPRDPVEAFRTWYEYQWEGGIVTKDWLERSYDNDPKPVDSKGNLMDVSLEVALETEGQLFYVRGLKELHPDPIHEEFEKHYDLGVGMMTFYKEYAAKNDHFVVLSAESKFSVPLGFEAKDFREESPNYGKMLEVHARGTRDAIIYNPDSERFGLLDHKTAGEIGDNYFTKLEMDEQVGTYFWATQYEAEVYDMPYKRIDRFIYNVLRKAYPKPPTVLKDGFSPSINRKDECTTAELFAKHIDDMGIRDIYNTTTKWQSYYNWLVQIGDANFVQRQSVTRNAAQIDAIQMHYRMVAEEMLSETLKIYPTPSGNFLCTSCVFRAPCLAADDGSDFVHMLFDGYEENRGR